MIIRNLCLVKACGGQLNYHNLNSLLTISQGQLQIWMEHSTLIFANLKPVEISKNHSNII